MAVLRDHTPESPIPASVKYHRGTQAIANALGGVCWANEDEAVYAMYKLRTLLKDVDPSLDAYGFAKTLDVVRAVSRGVDPAAARSIVMATALGLWEAYWGWTM